MARDVDRLQEVFEQLRKLEARVASLEHALHTQKAPAAAMEDASPSLSATKGAGHDTGFALGNALTLGGRSLLVLGGAFLLRALTEGGLLSPGLGVGLGMAYALLWVFFSYRAGLKGQRAGAAVHGLVAALIGYPLLIESITRFGLFPVWPGAAAVCLFLSIGLWVAARRSLRLVAWSFVVGAVVAAWVLLVSGLAVLPVGAMLLVVGGTTLWLSNRLDWRQVRWLAALQIDALVLVLGLLLLLPGTNSPDALRLSAASFRLICTGMLAVYLGSFVVWALLRRHHLGGFEVAQGLFAVVVGFGGIVATRGAGGAGLVLALVALACALMCYGVAFSFGDRAAARRINFYLFSWLALLFIVLGSLALAGGWWLTVALCALALVSTGLGVVCRRSTLQYQGAVYLSAAALQGGVAEEIVRVFFGPAGSAWPSMSPGYVLVLATAAACYVWLVTAQRALSLRWTQITPRAAAGGWFVAGLGAVAVFLLAALFSAAPPSSDPAVLAVVRTAVLAVSAIVLGMVGQWVRLRELAWLVIPILVLAGIKLLLEDVRQGRPATLFVGFACYGIALIVVAQMVRKRSSLSEQQLPTQETQTMI